MPASAYSANVRVPLTVNDLRQLKCQPDRWKAANGPKEDFHAKPVGAGSPPGAGRPESIALNKYNLRILGGSIGA